MMLVWCGIALMHAFCCGIVLVLGVYCDIVLVRGVVWHCTLLATGCSISLVECAVAWYWSVVRHGRSTRNVVRHYTPA